MGRKRNTSTDGICAGEDPYHVCLVLHKNGVPSMGRDLRFPHYPCFWGLPYLMKTAILPPSLLLYPLVQSTSPAHSASLTRLQLPILWSSPRRWAHSCSSTPFLLRGFRTRGNIPYVVSAELVGYKHFPWAWIPYDQCVPSPITIFVFRKLHELQCIAFFFFFFFVKPGEEYKLNQKYVHLGLNAFHLFLKPRNCLIFDRHYLLNTTCEGIGLQSFTSEWISKFWNLPI